MPGPIEFFRNRAKRLSKERAATRLPVAGPSLGGLMKCQHDVATEYGFKDWTDLKRSSVADLQAAIDRQPSKDYRAEDE